MLGISKKPGPPVPPRPSAAAVATALAKQRENSPSPNGGSRGSNGGGMVGMATLKPPHPGRTVVYKSPDFDQPQARNRSHLSTFGGSVPEQLQGSPNPATKRNAIYHDSPGQSPQAMERKLLNAASGGVMYRSTCSIVEINTSPSTSGSSSVSTSPVATLQKHSADQMSCKLQKDSLPVAPIARRRVRTGDSHSSEGSPDASEVIIINGGGSHGSSISLMSAVLQNTENGHGKSLSECDSGTERGDSSGSSASAGSTLERENNAKNLESSAKSSHFTEIIIGSNQSSTVVRSGSKPNISTTNSVIRSNSIRLPVKAAVTATPPPLYHRPEPEGGEHVQPSSDHRAGTGTIGASVTKSQSTTTLDPATLDSKLSEKKIAFHELLISELTAMRQKQKEQDQHDRPMANRQEVKLSSDESTLGVDLVKINRRQRCPSERRSSGSETETTPNGTATRLPKIRTADWIEVGDNGKQVVLSSCQISLEDSGMEDEEKLDDASSGVGDSWDSVKEDAEERIIMSLPGLPPLPKSLSGFDLAGIQFQSHHQHHHQHPSQHNPHYPPTHHHLQQSTTQSSHHHPMQPQSFHGTPPHPSSMPPSSQSPAAVLNHHHTNPFIPIGSGLLHGDSLASLESQQRGHSPVSSTLSGGSSTGGRKASPQPPGSGPASTATLDTQLAILRREMYGLRQLDLSLLSQLWALNESIQEFRTMLQEQETLSPPSPTPSNSDANSVSSDDDLDEDDSSTTNNSNRLLQHQQQQHLLLSAHHQLQSSTSNSIGGSGTGSGGNLTPGAGPNPNESGGSSTTTLSSSASSRMRAPPPPPPNRKAPSRPV
ncbi:lateral signaling target protein 2 homolog isoform X1 [Anopheles funestus]|uniref:lateral signaling target protein 2 homolog isoform X1 n=1 Tax=Anopheles funestus TaxID=62324 RepID=UPI0020C5CF2E|nr:lateral signaling target protein 2 homolog isoform X1 [Anopheles funestus]XP_049279930.1 lateral signaling target protein 2 homolog isoform X1 [Anopheles funestus]XP_049279931.1 lateral signaling target protein 2 homolog isoform X1 [Anopheles funestus]XP_049279932.1 lateral signaling target protein 2 homolog isoform X1 [Anopheles funestus]